MRFPFFVKEYQTSRSAPCNCSTIKQNLLIFILIVLLAAIFSSGFIIFEFQKFEKEISEISQTQVLISFNKPSPEITLIFIGDIMLDRGVEWAINKYGKKDWKFPFLKIADNLKEADILFGNLEGPISNKGIKVGSIYSFRTDPKVIEGLNYAGFDILSVANNHIFDYSWVAMEDSFKRLKEAGIDYVGGGFNENEAYSPVIKEIRDPSSIRGSKSVKIAFLAYNNLGSKYWEATVERSGISWLTEERLVEDIKKAKSKADIVIISMHFGEEYQTKANFFQKLLARAAIDAGADLIIGHHSHVVQEIEEYKGKYIAYSLGNFVFDQGFSKETMQGLLLKVIIKNGKITEIIPINIKINKFFQPEIVGE